MAAALENPARATKTIPLAVVAESLAQDRQVARYAESPALLSGSL